MNGIRGLKTVINHWMTIQEEGCPSIFIINANEELVRIALFRDRRFTVQMSEQPNIGKSSIPTYLHDAFGKKRA